jgi:hypothetical protein
MFCMCQVNILVDFEKLEYLYHMQMIEVTHQNTLATFRRSLGTMFMKVISPNYASKN